MTVTVTTETSVLGHAADATAADGIPDSVTVTMVLSESHCRLRPVVRDNFAIGSEPRNPTLTTGKQFKFRVGDHDGARTVTVTTESSAGRATRQMPPPQTGFPSHHDATRGPYCDAISSVRLRMPRVGPGGPALPSPVHQQNAGEVSGRRRAVGGAGDSNSPFNRACSARVDVALLTQRTTLQQAASWPKRRWTR